MNDTAAGSTAAGSSENGSTGKAGAGSADPATARGGTENGASRTPAPSYTPASLTPAHSLLSALDPNAAGQGRSALGAMPVPTMLGSKSVRSTDVPGIRVKVPGGQTGKPTNNEGSFDTSGTTTPDSALADLLNLDVSNGVQDGLGQVAQLIQSTVDSARSLVKPVLDNASSVVLQAQSTLHTITANTTSTTHAALNTLSTVVANTVHSVQAGAGAMQGAGPGQTGSTAPVTTMPPGVSATTPVASDVHPSQTTPVPQAQPPQDGCGQICTLQSIASAQMNHPVTAAKVTMRSTTNSDGSSNHPAPVPTPAQSAAATGSSSSAGGHAGSGGQALSDLASLKLPGISNTGSSTSDAWILPSSISFEPGHSPD